MQINKILIALSVVVCNYLGAQSNLGKPFTVHNKTGQTLFFGIYNMPFRRNNPAQLAGFATYEASYPTNQRIASIRQDAEKQVVAPENDIMQFQQFVVIAQDPKDLTDTIDQKEWRNRDKIIVQQFLGLDTYIVRDARTGKLELLTPYKWHHREKK